MFCPKKIKNKSIHTNWQEFKTLLEYNLYWPMGIWQIELNLAVEEIAL